MLFFNIIDAVFLYDDEFLNEEFSQIIDENVTDEENTSQFNCELCSKVCISRRRLSTSFFSNQKFLFHTACGVI